MSPQFRYANEGPYRGKIIPGFSDANQAFCKELQEVKTGTRTLEVHTAYTARTGGYYVSAPLIEHSCCNVAELISVETR